MASRSESKARNAIVAIRDRIPGASLSYLNLDLSSLSSIAETASALNTLPRVDALVLNAAALLANARAVTVDGNENVFGVNAVGNFALTAQTMGVLERTSGSRVVTLASTAPWLARLRTIDLANVNSTSGPYQGFPTYARSKAAQMVIGLELDRRLRHADSHVASVLAHPGGAHDGLSPRRAGVIEPTLLQRAKSSLFVSVGQGKDRGGMADRPSSARPGGRGRSHLGSAALVVDWATPSGETGWCHPQHRLAGGRRARSRYLDRARRTLRHNVGGGRQLNDSLARI